MQTLAEKYIDYMDMYRKGMESLELDKLEVAIEHIKNTADREGTIYVAGNGGSASISNHLCCDFLKTADHRDFFPLNAVSLSANASVLTAIANDISYEATLSYQLDRVLNSGDHVVILISSSGNSPNIVAAAKLVKNRGIKLIGLTGFSGGELKKLADVSLHIPVDNYGVVEDAHQSIMHLIAQRIGEERAQDVNV